MSEHSSVRALAPAGNNQREDVPSNTTIGLDTLTRVRVVTNVHSSVFFGAVCTHAHLAASGETASRLRAKANGFRKGCEVLSRYSFILGEVSVSLEGDLAERKRDGARWDKAMGGERQLGDEHAPACTLRS